MGSAESTAAAPAGSPVSPKQITVSPAKSPKPVAASSPPTISAAPAPSDSEKPKPSRPTASPSRSPVAGVRRDALSPEERAPTPALQVSGLPADFSHSYGATLMDDLLLDGYLVLADAVALFLTGSSEPAFVIDYLDIEKWGANEDLFSLYFRREGVDDREHELLLQTDEASKISATLTDTLSKLYPETALETAEEDTGEEDGSALKDGDAKAEDAADKKVAEVVADADDDDAESGSGAGGEDASSTAAARGGEGTDKAAGVEEAKGDPDAAPEHPSGSSKAGGNGDDDEYEEEVTVDVTRFAVEVVPDASDFNASISIPEDADVSIIIALDGLSLSRTGSPDEIWHVSLPEVRSWHHGGDDPTKPDEFSMSLLWDDQLPVKLSFHTKRAREISASLSLFITETMVSQAAAEAAETDKQAGPAPPPDSPPGTPPGGVSSATVPPPPPHSPGADEDGDEDEVDGADAVADIVEEAEVEEEEEEED